MKNQSGFTMIELMIALVIIAILSSIAIPAYKGYVTKARVSEGIEIARDARRHVEIDYATGESKLGASFEAPKNMKWTKSVTVNEKGNVTVEHDAPDAKGTIIFAPTFEATGHVTWDCTTGTLKKDFRPKNCQ